MTKLKLGEYKEGITKRNRNGAILEYIPLIKAIVYSMNLKFLSPEKIQDTISAGIEGLIGAIDRFIPASSSFRTYAEIRIRGNVLDHRRKEDFVGRTARRHLKNIDKFTNLKKTISPDPIDISELCNFLEIDRSRYYQLMENVGNSKITHIDDYVDTEGYSDRTVEEYFHAGDNCDPEATIEKKILCEVVRKEIDELSPRMSKIIKLLFLSGKTNYEAAKIMKLSKGRVSQLKHKALKILEKKLIKHFKYEGQLIF